MKHAFVILHYKTAEDTTECIESIFHLNDFALSGSCIVVVDNCSNNASIEYIEKKYRGTKKVVIIKNDTNLGFAKGNNVGYQYARFNLHVDFISILNNDIKIESKDYLRSVEKAYEKSGFHVMGPDIVSLVDGGHQNPYDTTSIDIDVMKKRENKYKFLLFLNKIGLYSVAKKFLGRSESQKRAIEYNPEMIESCQLHGSFLVFSPKYIEREAIAFYPKTFLYYEEAILYQHCIDVGYKTLYYPDVLVYHKEDSSTSFLNNTEKKKREFVFRNLIASSMIYREFLGDKKLWDICSPKE